MGDQQVASSGNSTHLKLLQEVVKDWSPRKRVTLLRKLEGDPGLLDKICNSLKVLNDPPLKADLEVYLDDIIGESTSSLSFQSLTGEQLVFKICTDFWNSIHSSLDAIPKYGHWLHAYAPSKQEVCTFGSHREPNLLWTALNMPFETSQYFKDKFFLDLQKKMRVLVLLGASGAGKTRTILEWGNEKNCIIFTGREDSAFGNFGSGDVLALARHMQMLFPGQMQIDDRNALSSCIGALLVVRFFILVKCKEGRVDLTNYDWLCLQLEFLRLGISDIFEQLALRLMQTFVVASDSTNWGSISSMFWHIIDRLQKDIGWNGFIAIDECQEINRYLSNRFSSVGLGNCQRSILNPFLIELSKYPRTSTVIISGTGCSILGLRSSFQSGSLKQFSEYSEFLDFKGFDRMEGMKNYAEKFIDTCHLDMDRIFHVYRGRYRFFVTALERYMGQECVGGTFFFLQFANEICGSRGVELGLLRSIKDDVAKLFNTNDPRQVQMVIELILGFYFRGVATMQFVDRAAFKMVEYGVGRVMMESTEDNGVFAYSCALPFEEKYDEFAKVKIDEPLVMKALLNYLKSDPLEFDKHCIRRFVHAVPSDSKIGEDYEVYVADSLGCFFDGKRPVEMLPNIIAGKYQIEDIYKEEAQLVQSKDPILACLVKDVSPEYRLLDWINEIECEGSFATYLHTGLDNDCGPDLVFVLYIDAMGKYMPVLCQMKTGKVDQREALLSLDVETMYKHNNAMKVSNTRDDEGVHKLKEWCASGYIQLVVTTPMEDLCHNVEKHYTPLRMNPKRQTKKALQQTPCVKPLYGVVDRNNCQLFLHEWICETIKHLKANTRSMRKR